MLCKAHGDDDGTSRIPQSRRASPPPSPEAQALLEKLRALGITEETVPAR